MDIIYHNRKPVDKEIEKRVGAKYVSFEELLEKSDVISIHAPLTEETDHLFSKDVFEKMKKGAFLINTGRGAIIDEDALAYALETKKISGAGLDVYEYEPKVNERILKLSNVVLLPHIGSASTYARGEMSRMAAQAIVDVYNGNKVKNRVV